MEGTMDLFSQEEPAPGKGPPRPLADRMRPRTLDEFVGQEDVLGPDSPLRRLLQQGKLRSMIFWGPPGCGKTTLALLLARITDCDFVSLSAVTASIREVREVMERARINRNRYGRRTLLFIDEIHRFNKAQQDAFLPFVEDGSIILVGATTENPSFSVIAPLLSRCEVVVLRRLSDEHLCTIIERALTDTTRGLGNIPIDMDRETVERIAQLSDGDARRALNLLELCAEIAPVDADGRRRLTAEVLAQALRRKHLVYDKAGEEHYNLISALHKSVRGSDPDAALYWLVRMLDGGAEPRYLARRLVRMASEDIGLADPRALRLALDAAEVYERLGSPEGELALAECVVYLAVAPKSNAVYKAFNAARAFVKQDVTRPVPMHLRNAPTKLMKELDYGKGYRYAHDEEGGFAAGERYLPEGMAEPAFYQPVPRGLEIRIGEKMAELRRRNRDAGKP